MAPGFCDPTKWRKQGQVARPKKIIGRRLSRSLGAHAGLEGSSSASIVYSMQPWCREPGNGRGRHKGVATFAKTGTFSPLAWVWQREKQNKTQHLASAASHNTLPLPSTRSVLGIGNIPAHPRHQTSSPCSTCAAWTKPSARQDFLFIFYFVWRQNSKSQRLGGFSVSGCRCEFFGWKADSRAISPLPGSQ